ncbi:MAG: SGNH/GDSL hydrolase family protein [Bacillota bacterium]
MIINKGDRVLFQGDSITDCGRNREDDDLGSGYPYFAASLFSSRYPELEVEFLNRGIGGDRVRELEDRWAEDALNLKPDVISILIGINDTWDSFRGRGGISAEQFKETYHRILSLTRKKTAAKIIICEPFLLPVRNDNSEWRKDLDPKINVCRELAREFDTFYLPLDGIFARVCTQREPDFWAEDGVHPSPAGHALIARKWLDLTGY